MSTFGIMITEIEGDLRRSNMTDDVKKAIAAALAFYRNRRLAINTKTFTFTTVISQEYYTSADNANIPLVAKDDSVTLIDGTIEFPIKKVDTDWMDRNAISATYTSVPDHYAYVRQSFRLFPVPNAAKTVRVNGILELIDANQPAADRRLLLTNCLTVNLSYSSDWFTDGVGYQIIKAWAKGAIYKHKLRNQEEAVSQWSLAADFAAEGKAQAAESSGTGFVEPTQF